MFVSCSTKTLIMNRTVFFICLIIPYTWATNYVASLPMVVNTWNFRNATAAAWHSLYVDKESVIDAVVKGCTECEVAQCDTTVGYGGSPDENGETTLDAMIMDATTMNIGAVAALRNVKNVIGVAKHVLQNTQHTLLVGNQATDFAIKMGFTSESLSTNVSQKMYTDWRANNCQPNYWLNVEPDPTRQCGPYEPTSANDIDTNFYRNTNVNSDNHDTIGMIAIDKNGNMAAGTSTNGLRHKIPGRVGDSPIPGCGAYAENGVGAAVATGDGDVMMRFLPAFYAVQLMEQGAKPETAAQKSIERIRKYHPEFFGAVIAVTSNGTLGAACNGMMTFPYSMFTSQTGNMVHNKKCI